MYLKNQMLLSCVTVLILGNNVVDWIKEIGVVEYEI